MKTKFFHSLLAMPVLLLFASCTALDYYVDPDAESVMAYSKDSVADSDVEHEIESATVRYQYKGSDGDCTCVIDFKRPMKMRISYFNEKFADVYTLNGENSWQYENDKFTKLSVENGDDIMVLSYLLPFAADYNELATKLKLEEETDYAGGEECYVLSGTTPKKPSFPCKLWFSKKTKLLNQMQIVTDDGIYETTFMEYAEFAGMQFAKYIYSEGPGQPTIKLTLEEVEVNQMKDDSIFERPVTIDSILKAE